MGFRSIRWRVGRAFIFLLRDLHFCIVKLAGATYMEIYEAGGGIHFTVNHTRQATEDELYELLKQRLMRMLHNGTTKLS